MQRNAHAFSQGNLFQTYNLETFKFKPETGTMRDIKKNYKIKEKKDLPPKIFLAFMKLVMKDLVTNGSTFHLPIKTISMFTWKSIKGEEFIKSYQSGKFDDIDFLSTNFTLYVPIFKYFYKGKFKEKSIVMDKTLRAERVDKINKGFKYC